MGMMRFWKTNNLSTKTKVAITAIVMYVIAFLCVMNTGTISCEQGIVKATSEDILVVHANTGEDYMIENSNRYTQYKKVGDSIEFGVDRANKAYDKVSVEGMRINQETTRFMYGMGIGVLGIITMLCIFAFPFGETCKEAIYYEAGYVEDK